jgi:hypothetical protein
MVLSNTLSRVFSLALGGDASKQVWGDQRGVHHSKPSNAFFSVASWYFLDAFQLLC